MMLRTVPDEPDQVPRLDRFRAAHPDVRIAAGQTGWWQGRIPEPDGEVVITRYTLCDLLDKLDRLLPPAGGRGAVSIRYGTSWPGSPSRHAAPQERSGRDCPDARDPGLGFGSASRRRQPAS